MAPKQSDYILSRVPRLAPKTGANLGHPATGYVDHQRLSMKGKRPTRPKSGRMGHPLAKVFLYVRGLGHPPHLPTAGKYGPRDMWATSPSCNMMPKVIPATRNAWVFSDDARGGRVSTATDEKRLTDQIWRGYKLKYSVLVATLLCLWLVFSAVRTGERAVRAVDQKSVAARQEWYQSAIAQAASTGRTNPAVTAAAAQLQANQSVFKDPGSAELLDETELQIYALIIDKLGADADSQKARQVFILRENQLRDLMAERDNVYNLEFGFSNLKSTVVLNALVLIDSWPLVLLMCIALVVGIGLRQHATAVILSSLVEASTDQKAKAERLAATGFIVGSLTPHIARDEPILIYRRPLMLLPEPFITASLVGAILYFSLTIPGAEVPSRIAMRSSLWGYHSLVLGLALILTFVLAKARSYYQQQIAAVAGMRVFTPLTLWLWEEFATPPLAVRTNRAGRRVLLIPGILTLLSFLAPWVGNDKMKTYGYELFWRQRPLSGTSNLFYKVDPSLFREMRIQVLLAVVFVIWAVATAIWSKRRGIQRADRVLRVFCWAIVGLAMNFSVYLLLLRYRQSREMTRAVIGMLFGNGDLTGPRGLPLVIQQPLYGFVIFFSCVVFVCLTVLTTPVGGRLSHEANH